MTQEMIPVHLKDIFPDKVTKKGVFADWFTGKVTLSYYHGQGDMELTFKKGILIDDKKEKEISNKKDTSNSDSAAAKSE